MRTRKEAAELGRQIAELRPDQFDSFSKFQKRLHELMRRQADELQRAARASDVPGNCSGCRYKQKCPFKDNQTIENRYALCPREGIGPAYELRLSEHAQNFIRRVHLN